MGLRKAIEVGAAVAAGTALLALGSWRLTSRSSSGYSRSGRRRPTEESKASRGGGSGGGGDEDDGKQGSGTGLMVVAVRLRAALWSLGAWILTYSSEPSDPDDGRKKAMEESRRAGGDDGGGGDRMLPNSYSVGNPNQNLVARRIKIMTYNIWSRKDMEVHERMKAIGGLVKKHSPDVIFFQEVTPFIYGIFQTFKWWKLHEHSNLPEKVTRNHFCMLLSKLPVKVSSCISFENSILGRELHSAFIEIGREKKLVVATTHLKSPRPPVSMHSTERMAQAKKALNFLDYFPNVVFGGDMNWDEDSDGPLPLPDGWVDAWTLLRPGEDGWTFDTKSNPMLSGRKLLRKRLDRFLCKLKDFKLISLDIIGTEVIPGILCYDKARIVPTLPSDHYGLLLTVS